MINLGTATFNTAILLALTLGTILFFNYYQRFVVSGAELVKDNQFLENFGEWEHSIHAMTTGPGIASLHSENSSEIVNLSQKISNIGQYRLLRLACDIKASNVTHHKNSWNTARVILIFYNPQAQAMYHLPHTLATFEGTQDWTHYEGIFQVPANASATEVGVQLTQITGTLNVKKISLRPVAETESFGNIRKLGLFVWSTVLFWITLPLLRSARGNCHRTLIIALGIAIMFGVLMPDDIKKGIGIFLSPSRIMVPESSLTTAFKFTPLLPPLDIFKLGHFVLFTALAVAARFGNPYPASRTAIPAYLFVFALVTEVLQLFVSARSAQMGDVLIDSMGITLGVLLAYVMQVVLAHMPINRSR
ncbi:MAG: VanZ family protein [Methylococcaceae bacterium]|nr:VanZ family protein [Methylococcaceae bacterium]